MAALALVCLQETPVELRWTFAPAQERRFRIHQVFDLGGVSIEARDLVAVTAMEVDPEGAALLRGRYEAVALRSTGVQKYEYDSEKNREPGEHPNARMIATLLGRTFEYRMSRAGEVLEVRGFDRILEDMVRAAGGAQEEALAHQLFKQMFTNAIMKSRLQLMSTGLPAGPVRPGQDWENLLRLRLPMVGTVRFRGKSRVVGLKDGDASIEQDLKVDGVEDDPNNPLAGLYTLSGKKLESKSVFAAAAGCFRSVRLDLLLDLGTPGQAVPLRMAMNLDWVGK